MSFSNLVRLFSFLCMVILMFPSFAECRRAIPSDNLSYPVLITLDNEVLASGFYLRSETGLYLVTARHVLFEELKKTGILNRKVAELLSYSKDPNEPNEIILRLDLQNLHKNGLVTPHKTQDVAIVKVANVISADAIQGFKAKYVEGVNKIKPLTKSELVCVNYSNMKSYEKVLVSNDVFVFGYPISIGIEEMPQLEHHKPLLRKGIVAGKNDLKKTIIIDCPTYFGNSGGPVIQVEEISVTETKYSLIGLVSQFVPFKEKWLNLTYRISHWEISNSGYTVVTPIDAVLELLLLEEEASKTKGNLKEETDSGTCDEP